VPVKIVAEHSAEDIRPRGPLKRAIDWVLKPFTSAWVAVSEAQTSYLVSRKGVPGSRLHHIPNGVTIPDGPKLSREVARRRLGVPLDAFVIGTVSVLRPEKDHATLIGAFSSVAREVPSAMLVIAGDGPSAHEVRACAESRGLRDRVMFTGAVTDVGAVLSALDVYASSSVTEALPLSIMEAMGAGLPIVATEVGGVRELLDAGGAGVMVPPSDENALGEALIELSNDPERARVLGKAARVASRRYDAGVMAHAYESLLDELIAEPQTRRRS
jgi:glycosyltransferase involved in cell wall biosynthesis